MTTFKGGDPGNPLMADDDALWLPEPEHDYAQEAPTLAAQGQILACNDSLAAALLTTKLNLTHGPLGLLPSSKAALDLARGTSADERALRARIDAWRDQRSGREFDAGGSYTRRELERAADEMATVHGECYIVRVPGNGRRISSWRLVRMDRVSNPNSRPDTDALKRGWVYEGGRHIGIMVSRKSPGAYAYAPPSQWDFIPLFAADGTPNVAIRFGRRIIGNPRGVSCYSAILQAIKTLSRLSEAELTGRTQQALMPVQILSDNPKQTAASEAAYRPLRTLHTTRETEIKFLVPQWNGADLNAFMAGHIDRACATWGLPSEVVVAQMASANLASARAGLDQADRTAATWQRDQIEQVSSVLDEVECREAMLSRVVVTVPDLAMLSLTKYRRPAKFSTDALKDGKLVSEMISFGASETSAFERVNLDWEDEQESRAYEVEFRRIQAEKLATASASAVTVGTSSGSAIQDQALNGAQVVALVQILTSVAMGEMPVETARGAILAAFPMVAPADADSMLSPLKNFKPTVEQAP
jgi:capsid protein